MKKVLLALAALSVLCSSVVFAGGAKEGAKVTAEKKVINLWSFTDEVPKMMDKYKELHPEFDYEVKVTIIATTDGAYQPAIDQALTAGGKDAPDLFTAESAFVLKYTQDRKSVV